MTELEPNQLGALAAALSKAQSEMRHAVEDTENPFFKSRYASLASCWDACRGPLTKHGLAVTQGLTSDGRKVTVTTILLHSGGGMLQSALTVTAKDESPQAMGSASSYGRRYALAAMVGLASAESDDDGNEATARGHAHSGPPQGYIPDDIPPEAMQVPLKAPAKVPEEKYDPKNERHVDRLVKKLEEMQVPMRYWDDVGAEIKGKLMSQASLQAAIKKVVK